MPLDRLEGGILPLPVGGPVLNYWHAFHVLFRAQLAAALFHDLDEALPLRHVDILGDRLGLYSRNLRRLILNLHLRRCIIARLRLQNLIYYIDLLNELILEVIVVAELGVLRLAVDLDLFHDDGVVVVVLKLALAVLVMPGDAHDASFGDGRRDIAPQLALEARFGLNRGHSRFHLRTYNYIFFYQQIN